MGMNTKNIGKWLSCFAICMTLVACGGKKGDLAENQSSTSVEQTTIAPAKLPDSLLPFKKEKQLVLGELDQLKRATFAHIQMKLSDKPKVKRNTRINVDPVGWHNYKMLVDDSGSGKEAWLMNRGHLVGYQFSGLNDEARNLTPMTALLNEGGISHEDDKNQNAMLYYESSLAAWLNNHPNDWLDYKVTPIYQGDELIPRQVELQYAGIKSDGNFMKIEFHTEKEKVDADGVTHVVLENSSPNAKIDYATGTAEPLFAKKVQTTEQQAETTTVQQADEKQQVTVYVASGGRSDIYWYHRENMPKRTNMKNVIEMTEAQAIAQGKRHASKEKR